MESSKHIVVVDDDAEIRQLLTRYLETNRYQVTALEDGEQLLALYQPECATGLVAAEEAFQADMVVLDIMLPGANGFDICRQLRTVSQVPVIMLTANSDEMDRVVGLELGADDYLAKPFNPRELLARIRAILRRMEVQTQPVVEAMTAGRYLRFAEFELDTTSRHLHMPDGDCVSLSGADFHLLSLFLSRAGDILSRDFIASQTRGRDNQPMDRFIDVHISRLRQRLGEDARTPAMIKTVRGKGYVMACTVDYSDVPRT